MEQFQRDQQQLQQYYQQQRIMELQAAQQRQREMEFQNASRFTQMRDRAYAAVAPIGGFVPSELGMGRNIGQVGANGVSRQSGFGALVDAYMPGETVFFRTAGFQFNMSEAAVRDRARQNLRAMRRDILPSFAASMLPDFAQRSFHMVGQDQVGERSLGMMDAFAGLRGNASNPITGRGITRDQAFDMTLDLNRRLNHMFNGRLDAEQIDMLQTAAQSSLTSRDIAQTAGNPNSVVGLLEKTISELHTIANNTGISMDSLNQIVLDNKAMGNSFNDLKVAAGGVGFSTTTTTVNREAQLRLSLGLTAQGRQMNVANAATFGQDTMDRVNRLVSGFNLGAVDRAELFRYGGENSFDAASRVINRQMQANQNFARQTMGTVGVLGAGATQSLQGGLVNFAGDVAQAYLDNPFAAAIAATDFEQQQRFLTEGQQQARALAESTIEGMNISDPKARRAMVAMEFGRLTGRDPLDARRELDMMEANGKVVRGRVKEFMGTFDSGAGMEADELASTAEGIYTDLLRQGYNGDEILTDESLRMISMGAKASRIADLAINRDMQGRLRRREQLSQREDDLFALGIDSSDMNKGEITQAINKKFYGRQFTFTAMDFDMVDEDFAQMIFERDMTDRKKDFDSVADVIAMFEQRGDVMGTMGVPQQAAMRERAIDLYLRRQHTINMENVERGTVKDTPLYVEIVAGGDD